MWGVRRVIVGASDSPGSIRALRYAADLARRSDAPVVAVITWVPPGGDLAERRAPSLHLRHIWEGDARQRLRDAIWAAWGGFPDDLTVQPVVLRGEPGVTLVDVAYAGDDLLVVGAGRRGRLARPWHGRVTRYCLAHASCPVLAVPPPALTGTAPGGLRAWTFRHRELTVDRALRETPGERLDRGRR